MFTFSQQTSVDYLGEGAERAGWLKPRSTRDFLFHHIAKTAGSTFILVLEKLFSPQEICPARIDPELEALTPAEKKKYRLYHGHFSYDGLNQNLAHCTRLVFLRDPVERAISQYHNWHDHSRIDPEWKERAEEHPEAFEAVDAASRMSLEQFVDSENWTIADCVHNHHTRYLAARRDWPIEPGYFDKPLYDEALENLHGFEFVGVTESFEESLQVFALTFGLLPWSGSGSFVTNINATKKTGARYDIPAALREKIIRCNAMDMKLYEAAQRLFRERLVTLLHRATSSHFQLCLGARKTYEKSLPCRVVIDLSREAHLRGFYYRETTILDGGREVAFRWTGSERLAHIECRFRVPEDAGVTVSLLVFATMDEEQIAEASFTLDGLAAEDITCEAQPDGTARLMIHFAPSPLLSDRTQHVFVLETPLIREPETVEWPRNLGIAIGDIVLEAESPPAQDALAPAV